MIYCLLDIRAIRGLFENMFNYAGIIGAAAGMFPKKSNTANPNGSTKRKKNPTTDPSITDKTSTTSAPPSPLGGFDMNQFNTKQRTMLAGLSAMLAALFGRR